MIITLTIMSFIYFSYRRLLTYLHIFQQDEYDSMRFLKWLLYTKSFDKKLTLSVLIWVVICVGLEPYVLYISNESLCHLPVLFLFIVFAFIERDPRRNAKKKLILTKRATRIFFLAIFLSVIPLSIFIYADSPFIWALIIQLCPIILIFSNELLKPIENVIQQRYWNEAHYKVTKLKPFIIGITGSYGKTSIKHILGHILKTKKSVLITPGSVNTPMGISRIIREELDSTHKYFIVEMGAYRNGSIANLCKLTPPDMAVITAIGHAHYERFKSLKSVAKTKFELAEAVYIKNGLIITNENTLSSQYTRPYKQKYFDNLVICGSSKESSLKVINIEHHKKGITVNVEWLGQLYTLDAPLYGEKHGINIAMAFAAACSLGIPPNIVVLALKSTPQITHRLNVQYQAKGITVIDDAYNSNPEGFASALELLDTLADPNRRRILVTPGMVELGKAHDQEHEKLGQKAAIFADIVLAICPERIQSFINSFKINADPNQEIILCSTTVDAEKWLQNNCKSNDVVLFENSLPDLYESKLKL